MRNARSAVMAADKEAFVPELPHDLDHIRCHLRFGIRLVIGRGWRFERAAIASEVGADDGEVPGQFRGYPVPHHVRLRVAMQQQQRWARSTMPQTDGATSNVDMGKGELWKQQSIVLGSSSITRPASYWPGLGR